MDFFIMNYMHGDNNSIATIPIDLESEDVKDNNNLSNLDYSLCSEEEEDNDHGTVAVCIERVLGSVDTVTVETACAKKRTR